MSRLRSKVEICQTIANFIIPMGPGPRTGSPTSILLARKLVLVGVSGFRRGQIRHLQHAIAGCMRNTKGPGLTLEPFTVQLLLDEVVNRE